MGMKKFGRSEIGAYGVIAAGTFLMAAGINLIYEPMSMVTGGFSGAGILLRAFVPVPLWAVTLALNIPLFLIAGRIWGREYVKKTAFATLCLSLGLAVLPEGPVAYGDYLMAAILGGALNGTGLRLVFGRGASTGGTDLMAVILQHFCPACGYPALLGMLDGVIVVLGMAVFGIQIGLYSIVAVFVTSKVMDRLIEGLKFAKFLYIISDFPGQIADAIMGEIGRGVTALNGRGMYSGREKKVLVCAVTRKESARVLRLVREQDKGAFVVISDAREVMGEGFGGK